MSDISVYWIGTCINFAVVLIAITHQIAKAKKQIIDEIKRNSR